MSTTLFKIFVHEIGKRRTLVEAEWEAALMRKIENMAEAVVLFEVVLTTETSGLFWLICGIRF